MIISGLLQSQAMVNCCDYDCNTPPRPFHHSLYFHHLCCNCFIIPVVISLLTKLGFRHISLVLIGIQI